MQKNYWRKCKHLSCWSIFLSKHFLIPYWLFEPIDLIGILSYTAKQCKHIQWVYGVIHISFFNICIGLKNKTVCFVFINFAKYDRTIELSNCQGHWIYFYPCIGLLWLRGVLGFIILLLFGEGLWLWQGEAALKMHSFRDANPQPVIPKDKILNFGIFSR